MTPKHALSLLNKWVKSGDRLDGPERVDIQARLVFGGMQQLKLFDDSPAQEKLERAWIFVQSLSRPIILGIESLIIGSDPDQTPFFRLSQPLPGRDLPPRETEERTIYHRPPQPVGELPLAWWRIRFDARDFWRDLRGDPNLIVGAMLFAAGMAWWRLLSPEGALIFSNLGGAVGLVLGLSILAAPVALCTAAGVFLYASIIPDLEFVTRRLGR